MNEKDFSKVPATACILSGGEVSFANGQPSDKSKTSPVRLTARSGKPIDHPYWGRIVHDLSGMRMHKPRLPIDYAHNDSEVLGYVNHPDIASGDLILAGALIPFSEGDRASEVLHKMREGVPYEASIFFGGDGIKVEEVGDGMVAQVNGYAFNGPGIIVREWPLRGVAICPYGADMNTESVTFKDRAKTYSVFKKQPEESKQMTEDKPVEKAVEETVPPVAESAPVAVEPTPAVEAEEKAEEALVAPVEAAPVEAEAQPAALEAEVKPEDQPAPVPVAQTADPRKVAIDEFCIMEKEFGAEIAAATFKSGGSFRDAEVSFYRQMRDQNESLKSEVEKLLTQLADKAGATPAAFAQTEKKPQLTLVELCARGTKK